MTLKRTLAASFLLTAFVWTLAAFPLYRHFFRGIPSSAHNLERRNARAMIMGDHLQFHYFHWLFSDMLAGHTPLFENRYEFNTGDDRARYNPAPYNMPFSLAYAAFRPLFGRAGAWNATLFLTLWLTHFLSWLWLRRLLKPDWLAGLVAAAAFAFPFRWVMLFGGSPTGMAMIWPALLALGLVLAIREDRPAGGFLAALAMLGAHFNDRHVLVFSFLAIPFFALAALLLRPAIPWRRPAFWGKLLLALLPLALTLLVLGWIGWRGARAEFAGTSLEAGRPLTEVLWYTPRSRGLTQWGGKGRDAHIYLGYVTFAFLVLHLLAILHNWRAADAAARRRSLAGLLLWLAGAFTVILALGPRGPWNGAVFDACRARLPGFGAIRQPAKIFAIVTFLLPGALACALADFQTALARRPRLLALPVLLLALLLADHTAQIRVTVCLLDSEQGAYAAVAEDAARDDQPPRAVVLPLWPGDTDWAALYQHYVSLYRIRMLNGYRPVVPQAYRDLTVHFSPLNLGIADEGLLDDLLGRGFRYLLLHEDAFPEKVSSFPVVFTRNRMLDHPRLQFLRQDQHVWAFRILETPRAKIDPRPAGPLFPARYWEAERLPSAGVVPHADPAVCGGVYARLEAGAVITGRQFRADHAPDPHLALRLRGQGTLGVALNPGEPPVRLIAADTDDWTWQAVPISAGPFVTPVLTVADGVVDVDYIAFHGAPWTPPAPGESVTFPADAFFHAGYSTPETGAVHLRTRYEPSDFIFYGPRLPFEAGRYAVHFEIETGAPAETALGQVVVETTGGPAHGPFPVVQGRPAEFVFTLDANRPVTLRFRYTRRADLTIRAVTLTRLDGE